MTRAALLSLLLLACGRPAPSEGPAPADAHVFARALTSGALSGCQELSQPSLRDECRLALNANCDAMETDLWGFECHFMRAERLRVQARYREAEKDCTAAGPYAHDCRIHLFKDRVRPVLEDLGDGAPLAEALQAAETLAEECGGGQDWEPPWGWWWRQVHSSLRPVDRSICEPLAGVKRRACQREALSALRLTWTQALSQDPSRCRSSTMELTQQDPTLAWVQNADLDDVVRQVWQRRCGG